MSRMSDRTSNEGERKLREDTLAVSSQYESAWVEHTMRISQRQSVIQWFVGAAGALLGYWFTQHQSSTNLPRQGDPLSIYIVLAITLLSFASALLIWSHNRVIQELSRFMSICERRFCREQTSFLYFYGGKSHQVRSFHKQQRILTRVILSAIIGVTDGIAVHVTFHFLSEWVVVLSIIASIFSAGIMFVGVWRDDGEDERRSWLEQVLALCKGT
jgi:hypothetical protein